MEYTLLECRQKALKNTIVNANGDFETILGEQVLIEEGDQILVSKSFVDTTLLTTSKVSIEEDTEISFKIGFYNNLYQKSAPDLSVIEPPQMPFYTLNHSNNNATPVLDHYLTQYSHKALDATQRVLTFAYLTLADNIQGSVGLNVGDITIQLEYLNYAGLPNSLSVYIPPYNSLSRPDITSLNSFRIRIETEECFVSYDNTYGTNGFILKGMTDKELADKYYLKIDYSNFDSEANIITDHFNIVENTVTFTLDKGVYDPSELAELINSKVDDFNSGFSTTDLILDVTRIPEETIYNNWGYKLGNTLVTNIRRVKPLLTNANNLPMMLPYDGTAITIPANNNGSFSFISVESEETGYSGFSTYPNTARAVSPAIPSAGVANRLFIGTNEFSLEYDPSTGRYRFTFLHMPLYLGNNPICIVAPQYKNNPVSPYIQENTLDVPPKFKYVAHNSGIFFTQMTPQSFWEDKLGLDLKMLHTPVKKNINNWLNGRIGGGQPAWSIDAFIPVGQSKNNVLQPLQSGKNTTDGLISYDIAVIKPAIDPSNASLNVFYPFMEQTFNASNPDKVLIGTQTEFIDGKKSVINEIISSGYYLLDIQSKFSSTLITSHNTSRSISQIINRYYSINTYTAQEGSDMVYTHKGEPVYLSSLKIRILNPDQSLASVGADNSVFIKIVKSPKITTKKK